MSGTVLGIQIRIRSISKRYGSGSFYHQAKKGRKTLIPTALWLLFDFLSFKMMFMYLQKVGNKQYIFFKNKFLVGLLGRSMTKTAGSGSWSIRQRHGSADPDPDPDPPQNVMDPQHWYGILHTHGEVVVNHSERARGRGGGGRWSRWGDGSQRASRRSRWGGGSRHYLAVLSKTKGELINLYTEDIYIFI